MTTVTDRHPFVAVVEDRFGGILTSGKHEPDGKACWREAASVARGVPWSDAGRSGLPDARPINDAGWSSDQARTAAMLPMGVALWDWPDWTPERRLTWAARVAERTIREIVPIALRAAADLNPAHAVLLRAAADRCEREAAAHAARVAAQAADSAGHGGDFTARAAYAARAASYVAAANTDRVLTLACRIWTECALESAA